MDKKYFSSSRGQALLITLLTLSVVLTMGLSLIAQTITDVSISETESQSVQAFEAAEAGVEEALRQLEEGSTKDFVIPFGDFAADVSVNFSPVAALTSRKIVSGEATTFWLNSFSLNGEDFLNSKIAYSKNHVKVCWDEVDNVEAAVYYLDTTGDYKVARNYLSDGDDCVGDLDKAQTILLPASSNADNKFINVRFYGSANDTVTVAMEGVGENLPKQGTKITSTATVNDVERKIEVVQGWPVPPLFFDFAVFSGGGLSK